MKKPLLIQLLIILGLSLSSCQLLPFGTETEPVSDDATSTSSPEEELASEQAEINEENQVADSEIEQKAVPARKVAGLKKATDPDEFIQGRGLRQGKIVAIPLHSFPLHPMAK